MHAIVTVSGQQFVYHNVTEVWSDALGDAGDYLHLRLAAHPSLVHFWRPREGCRTSVLLAGTDEDLTQALRERQGGWWPSWL